MLRSGRWKSETESSNCFGFAAAARDTIAKLRPGQKVTVKGKCVGKVTDELSIEDCALQ
jgi:hypothetical protein